MSLKEYVTLAVQKSAFEVGDKVKVAQSPYYSINTGDIVLITKKEFSCSFNIWCYYVNFEKEEDLVFQEDELCSYTEIATKEIKLDSVKVEKQIRGILEQTNYKRIQDVMTVLDWKWALPTGYEVPSLFEIKKCLCSLLTSLIKGVERRIKDEGEIPVHYSCSTGGFEVTFFKFGDSDFTITSTFSVDSQYGNWFEDENDENSED